MTDGKREKKKRKEGVQTPLKIPKTKIMGYSSYLSEYGCVMCLYFNNGSKWWMSLN